VLGPTPFTKHYNDISKASNNGSIIFFADDTEIHASHFDMDEVVHF